MSYRTGFALLPVLLGLLLVVVFSSLCLAATALPAEPTTSPEPPKANDIPAGLGLTPEGQAEPLRLSETPENQTERILWDKTPIPITLAVGHERLISFPGTVRVGIPNALTAQLRTQSQQGTVYWLALKPFAATRIQVQDSQSGQFYLIDLAAIELSSKHKNPVLSQPITIIDAEASRSNPSPDVDVDQTTVPSARSAHGQVKTSSSADYIQLTRYAAQQLYAPARLLKTPSTIHEAPCEHVIIDTLFRGQAIVAEPLAAWRKNTLIVTAVKLTNRSAQPVTLDPRLLRGQWRTATFQHGRLGSSFSDAKVSAVYLISERPFAEVMRVFQ